MSGKRLRLGCRAVPVSRISGSHWLPASSVFVPPSLTIGHPSRAVLASDADR